MRKIKLIALTAAISALTSISAMAGTWIEDSTGWWYDNGDSTYANNGWSWIDGKCYYFTPEGYCLVDTTTPDGYEVDENGAWIDNGTASEQKKEEEEAAKTQSFKFNAPKGYVINNKIEKGDMYIGTGSAIWVYEANYQSAVGNPDEINLDQAITNNYGVFAKRTPIQFHGSEWVRYDYTGGQGLKIIYSRILDGNWHVIYFQGRNADINTDTLMEAGLQQTATADKTAETSADTASDAASDTASDTASEASAE